MKPQPSRRRQIPNKYHHNKTPLRPALAQFQSLRKPAASHTASDKPSENEPCTTKLNKLHKTRPAPTQQRKKHIHGNQKDRNADADKPECERRGNDVSEMEASGAALTQREPKSKGKSSAAPRTLNPSSLPSSPSSLPPISRPPPSDPDHLTAPGCTAVCS
jgi:hypothetical protein